MGDSDNSIVFGKSSGDGFNTVSDFLVLENGADWLSSGRKRNGADWLGNGRKRADWLGSRRERNGRRNGGTRREMADEMAVRK